MPIAEEERHKRTLVTHRGAYRWIRMPSGLRKAPITFQHSLDRILSGTGFKMCLVYLDDVPIFLHKLEDQIKHVDQVTTKLENAGSQ